MINLVYDINKVIEKIRNYSKYQRLLTPMDFERLNNG